MLFGGTEREEARSLQNANSFNAGRYIVQLVAADLGTSRGGKTFAVYETKILAVTKSETSKWDGSKLHDKVKEGPFATDNGDGTFTLESNTVGTLGKQWYGWTVKSNGRIANDDQKWVRRFKTDTLALLASEAKDDRGNMVMQYADMKSVSPANLTAIVAGTKYRVNSSYPLANYLPDDFDTMSDEDQAAAEDMAFDEQAADIRSFCYELANKEAVSEDEDDEPEVFLGMKPADLDKVYAADEEWALLDMTGHLYVVEVEEITTRAGNRFSKLKATPVTTKELYKVFGYNPRVFGSRAEAEAAQGAPAEDAALPADKQE